MTMCRSSKVSLRGRMTPSKTLPASFVTRTSLHTRTPHARARRARGPCTPSARRLPRVAHRAAPACSARSIRDGPRPRAPAPCRAARASQAPSRSGTAGRRPARRAGATASRDAPRPRARASRPARAPSPRLGDARAPRPASGAAAIARTSGSHASHSTGLRARRPEQLAPALVGNRVHRHAGAAQRLQLLAEEEARLLDGRRRHVGHHAVHEPAPRRGGSGSGSSDAGTPAAA